jgi:hypothetical protein
MKNKTKGESPEEMITPKDIRKVKEAVRETIPAYKRVKGRLREYPKIEIEKEGLELQGEASQTY